MITYLDTTVFNAEAQTTVNTVNCVGVMGAGLALEFKLRFPEMCGDYIGRCARKEVVVGKPYLYKEYETFWVMNFPTKEHWKHPSKIEWLRQGLKYFAENYERWGITSAAFPPLGCDRGGLNWSEVKILMEEYLQDIEIDVFICLDRECIASGVEGIMIELLNNKQNTFWEYELGLKSNIAAKIIDYLPISRFREVRQIKGVGKQTYNELFKLLYDRALKIQQTQNKANQN